MKYYYNSHKQNAKRRGIPFNLSYQEWRLFWNRHPKQWIEKISDQVNWEIDRLDINRGYELNNIQLLEKYKNVQKWYEEDQFKITAKWHPKAPCNQTTEAPF